METRPVYRALNAPMLLIGVERKLFGVITVAALVIWNVLESLLAPLFIWFILVFLARHATELDPQFLKVIITSGRFATRYDPAKLRESRSD